MNCPGCYQHVANDEYRFDPWRDDVDEFGRVQGPPTRKLYVRCGHCGLYECVTGVGNQILEISGPLRNPADARRIERKIPAARRHPMSECAS